MEDPETGLAQDDERDPAQRIAASPKRYIRVMAGPGTGKSYAMQQRIGRLLNEGVAPDEILAITLTSVMAEDLTKDLNESDGPGAQHLKAYNIHGIAEEILKDNTESEWNTESKRILRTFERTPLFHDVAHSLGPAFGGTKRARQVFSKRDAAWATDYKALAQGTRSTEEIKFDIAVQDWFDIHGCVWRGQIISDLYNYLYENPHAVARHKYKHILVDEFQDLNPVEQQIISLLAENASVCIFGDENQSIYSFRHANPDGILSWDRGKTSEELDEISLSRCWRCPRNIVEMANHLITYNKRFTDPSRYLTPQEEICGEGRGFWGVFDTTGEEVDWITNSVKKRLRSGIPASDILILTPHVGTANRIARTMSHANIDAQCFYEDYRLTTNRARAAVSYLNLLVNPDDVVSLRWLLGHESRNWHAGAYATVLNYVIENDGSVWACLSDIAAGRIELSGVTYLVNQFERVKRHLETLNRLDVQILIDRLFRKNDKNLESLHRIATSITIKKGTKAAPADILAAIEASMSDPSADSELEVIRIMSLHKSKGLGARVVYVAGCSTDHLPGYKPSTMTKPKWNATIEEKRRLFYVAITRVKGSNKDPQGELILTHARKKRGRKSASATPFIRELGDARPEILADPKTLRCV